MHDFRYINHVLFNILQTLNYCVLW